MRSSWYAWLRARAPRTRCAGSRSPRADLEPGRYALICFLPDLADGKPHFMHGMMQEIEVGSELTSK
jgi:hypothetical protein